MFTLWSSRSINKGVNTSLPNQGVVLLLLLVVGGGESRWDGGKQMHFISPQCLFHRCVCWYHSKREGSSACVCVRVCALNDTALLLCPQLSDPQNAKTQPPVWSTFVLSWPSKPDWGGRGEGRWASGSSALPGGRLLSGGRPALYRWLKRSLYCNESICILVWYKGSWPLTRLKTGPQQKPLLWRAALTHLKITPRRTSVCIKTNKQRRERGC